MPRHPNQARRRLPYGTFEYAVQLASVFCALPQTNDRNPVSLMQSGLMTVPVHSRKEGVAATSDWPLEQLRGKD